MLPAVGVAVRDENRSILADAMVSAVEVRLPKGADPRTAEDAVRDHDFDVLSLHAGSLPVCGESACSEHVAALAAAARSTQANSITVRCSHRLTAPSLDDACRNIDALQKAFGRTRLFLEHSSEIAPGKAATETDFLGRVLQNTGCGWLLDIASVYAASRNADFDPYDFIAEVMPYAVRVQIHLSGGEHDERTGTYRDNHSSDIPDEVWSLFRHALVLGGHKTQAVFIERDQNIPAPEGWLKEVRHARFLVERVHGRQRMLHKRNLAHR